MNHKHQNNTMNTHPQTTAKKQSKVKELGSESDRHNAPPAAREARPQIDFELRQRNRMLPTPELLDLLKRLASDLYQRAQIVGNWVWIEFPTKQPPTVTSRLAELGFHWNNKRQCWQHPCGPVTVEASPDDPRGKYGVTRAADLMPA